MNGMLKTSFGIQWEAGGRDSMAKDSRSIESRDE